MPQTLRDYLLSQPADADPQAVADAYNAQPPATVAAIPLVTLAPYLRKYGLVEVLKAVVADPAASQPTRVGLASFLDQLTDPRQTNLDTTDPVIAGQTAAILGGLGAMGLIAPDQVAGIYGLGGGLARPTGVSAADVAAERATLAAAAAEAARLAHQRDLMAAIDARLARLDVAAAYARKVLLDHLEAVRGGDLDAVPPADADVVAAYADHVGEVTP